MGISVLVVDDHEVVLSGLVALLSEAEIHVVAQATNGVDAVAKTLEHQPDVVLMDIRMIEGDGLTALEEITQKSPHPPVVMLSTYDNPTYIARSVALGAHDDVLKGAPREKLIRAIHRAASGQPPEEESVTHAIRRKMEKKVTPPADPQINLTRREYQVLRHLALGLSNREIGQSLDISVETVKEHVQNILRKLKLTDRTQAAVWAVKNQIV